MKTGKGIPLTPKEEKEIDAMFYRMAHLHTSSSNLSKTHIKKTTRLKSLKK